MTVTPGVHIWDVWTPLAVIIPTSPKHSIPAKLPYLAYNCTQAGQ